MSRQPSAGVEPGSTSPDPSYTGRGLSTASATGRRPKNTAGFILSASKDRLGTRVERRAFTEKAQQTWVRSESGLFPFLRLERVSTLGRLHQYGSRVAVAFQNFAPAANACNPPMLSHDTIGPLLTLIIHSVAAVPNREAGSSC
jgi:hypothetical protein